MLHIGIVACSTEGAALCYRTISLEGAAVLGKHDHPEVSLHSHSLAEYMKRIDAGDWAGVAELMLSSADKLAKGGGAIVKKKDILAADDKQAMARTESDADCPVCEVLQDGRKIGSIV